MAGLTWDLLRDLAEFHSADATALSFYASLEPSHSPTPQAVATRFNSLLNEAEARFLDDGVDPSRKAGVRAGLERIRRWYAGDFDRGGVQGVAVFVSAADGYWRVVTMPDPVADLVEVDRQFALTPLLPLAERMDDVFVALVDRERGRIYRLEDGRLDEVVDETEEVPGQHDQGGWSQARYQRHIEHLVKEHLKAVGDELDGNVRRVRGARLVVVAPEELRGELEAKLSTEARRAIVGWAHAEPHATPAELLEVVEPIVERVRAERRREQLERWHEQLGRNLRATSGWHCTLEAASDARVELLLADRSVRRTGYRCPACLRAAAEAGACPIDGATLEPHDALDLAVHQTLVHGGNVLSFDEGRNGLTSVGALLRF